jgi:putative hemolysin
MGIEIAIAVLLLFLLTFLATVDMAFSQLSDVMLRRLTSETEENIRVNTPFMREILQNRPRFRFALSAAIQILVISFTVLVALITSAFLSNYFQFLAVSLLVSIIASYSFRQIIPRLLTLKNPENKLLFLLPVVRPLYGFLSIIADPFRFLTKDDSSIEATIIPNQTAETEKEDSGGAGGGNEDIQALIEMGEAEGIIEEEERELIETMVEFTDTRAGEIMTPRTEICALPITATVRQARDLIVEEKYSRLPVYRDSVDHIEGILYVRDLLNAWSEDRDEANQTIENYLRPAFFVPETKSASQLMKNMQSNHVQIAIVIDEYGGVAGLITLEDIVEEIVGEIEDEDIGEEEIIEIIEGEDKSYYDVIGSTEIGKIERLFNLEIEDDDFTTIAGLVTSEAGYVPKMGETLNIRGLDVEILQADEKKISLLRLKKPALDDMVERQEPSA